MSKLENSSNCCHENDQFPSQIPSSFINTNCKSNSCTCAHSHRPLATISWINKLSSKSPKPSSESPNRLIPQPTLTANNHVLQYPGKLTTNTLIQFSIITSLNFHETINKMVFQNWKHPEQVHIHNFCNLIGKCVHIPVFCPDRFCRAWRPAPFW